MKRPVPPLTVIEAFPEIVFQPAPEVIAWATTTFIESGAALYNEDHHHLNFARLGALWTNVPNGRAGRRIVGQCEAGIPGMGKWTRARLEQQLIGWFGAAPDFVLTFDAEYAANCSEAEFMALVEHELYHAGQEKDAFGAPKFRKSGQPAFGIRGHDVEEFVGVVRRYGSDAAHVREMVEAARRGPEISAVRISQACGTCLLKAA